MVNQTLVADAAGEVQAVRRRIVGLDNPRYGLDHAVQMVQMEVRRYGGARVHVLPLGRADYAAKVARRGDGLPRPRTVLWMRGGWVVYAGEEFRAAGCWAEPVADVEMEMFRDLAVQPAEMPLTPKVDADGFVWPPAPRGTRYYKPERRWARARSDEERQEVATRAAGGSPRRRRRRQRAALTPVERTAEQVVVLQGAGILDGVTYTEDDEPGVTGVTLGGLDEVHLEVLEAALFGPADQAAEEERAEREAAYLVEVEAAKRAFHGGVAG